jgi:hypothetical protein
MYTTDYTDLVAKITPAICNLGIGGWTVTKPRALPETNSAGPSVIVRIEQGSARITVLWELVDAPQWDLTINIAGIPSKWDEDESEDYMLAIKIAQRVASLLKYHLA